MLIQILGMLVFTTNNIISTQTQYVLYLLRNNEIEETEIAEAQN